MIINGFPTTVGTSNSTIAEVNTALTNLLQNIQSLNNYGIGIYTPIFQPVHITSNATINTTQNGQMQVIGVRSATSGITITLPLYTSNIIEGSMFYIFDETGNANTYNITVDRNGNLINGATSNKTINANYGYIVLYCYKVGLTQAEFIILGSSGVI